MTVANWNLDRDGFEIVPDVLTLIGCEALTTTVAQRMNATNGQRAGLRNLFRDCPLVRQTALKPDLLELLQKRTGQSVFPVRVLFFDKTDQANWRVPWHQDLSIAVTERSETPGFGPWSVKAGVVHVQPPVEILESMVTIRLHLDDCRAENGALKVIPGSHRHGRLAAADIAAWRQKQEAVICEVPRGGALFMRPLLLHASSPAEQPNHRRVLHIEYAGDDLPGGLRWFERQ